MIDKITFLIAIGMMSFAAYSDLTRMIIPNWISIALLLVYCLVGLLTFVPFETLGLHLACGLAALGIGYGMFYVGWIGGGDAKLMAASLVWIGFEQAVLFLLYMSVFGAAVALLKMLYVLFKNRTTKLSERIHLALTTQIPYGVAIALAFIAVTPLPIDLL